ncbi:MAG: hypothetical protein LWX83_19220, partial [Anaerolineae bacterium]|nr:hypothetical protein [Anaerolineae bacterium]
MPTLTTAQLSIVNLPSDQKIFLQGSAMTGKSSVGAARLRFLLNQGIPPESILILTPQRTLAGPYYDVAQDTFLPAGGSVNIMTLGGLAQRLISLFWPIVAEAAGFTQSQKHPSFLTLESAQYYLASIVTPLLEEGYFESINVDRNRILSQILDNLNKAALTGINPASIADRLKSARAAQPNSHIIYDQAQDCALRFREYCLNNNLLDYSLQIEIFHNYLLPSPLVKNYIQNNYQHLIVDNIEEDTPVTHLSIASWLPDMQSALLIYDLDGGYRAFLGADPSSALDLKDLCDTFFELTENFITSPDLKRLSNVLQLCINHGLKENIPPGEINQAYNLLNYRYYPDMVEGVAEQINILVQKGVAPSEIAVLSPFLSDSLRFSLTNRLQKFGILSRSHRPSRSLREEPSVQCLLNWAKLAHPQWKLSLSSSDVRLLLQQSISGIDMLRADLMAGITYRENHLEDGLSSFQLIRPDMQERITHTYGQAFETLRAWLNDYK